VVKIDMEAAAAGTLSFAVAFVAAFAACLYLVSSVLVGKPAYACLVESPCAEPVVAEEGQSHFVGGFEVQKKIAEVGER
jgi:hypothetical protein